jgi:hypothetical protein
MTTQPIKDTLSMIASTSPLLHPTTYIYTSLPTDAPETLLTTLLPHIFSYTRESEGPSLLLPLDVAKQHGLVQEDSLPLRHIELRVFSSLEGVGLTAAVATALTERCIPCNVVAALRHDHAFVPEGREDEAMGVIREIAGKAKRELDGSGD